MKALLEFNLPEDTQDFKDYQDGVKLKYFMHQWLQEAKWLLDKPVTAAELLDNLKQELDDQRIDIFE